MFRPAIEYATNHAAAHDYVCRRHTDSMALLASNIHALPYVKVDILGSLDQPNQDVIVIVGGVWCSSLTCALAYILAKWW